MTIREVLVADWDVDRIDVIVREAKTEKYIMRYLIGRDVKPGRSSQFLHETEAGDIYTSAEMKTLCIKRIIQFCQLEHKPKSKIGCRGIIEREIPHEIMDLEIEHMSPYHCGYLDELHGYCFSCNTDNWGGVKGEYNWIGI